MMGIRGYVRRIGMEVRDWVEEFGDLFLRDVDVQQN
jgi:hypothetical protein